MKGIIVIRLKKVKTIMNELKKVESNISQLTGGQKLQAVLLRELEQTAETTNQNFSEYGKKCIMNAIAGIVTYCKNNEIDIEKIDATLLRLSLQNIGYTELNYSSMPSEIYFDIRKSDNGKYTVTIKPQGAGNEKLTRKYGVGLKKDIGLKPAWLIREGDEFTYPSFDGLKMTPPKWTPKSYDKKIVMVVYPAEKIDGSVEYLIATRESVKANIIAQIRQNALYSFMYETNGKKYPDKKAREKFYAELDNESENMSVDELIKSEKYQKYINPTYTSGGSREQMILRKMKNNALKNYPKEYDNAYIRDAVENMFEDNDDSLKEKKEFGKVIDLTEKVEKEIDEVSSENAIKDFDITDEGEILNKQEESNLNQNKVEESQKTETESTNYDDLI